MIQGITFNQQVISVTNTRSTLVLMLVLLLCFGIAAAGRLDNTYLPPSNARTAGGNGNFLDTPSSQYGAPNGGLNGNGGFNVNRGYNGNGVTHAAPAAEYGAPVIAARRPNFQNAQQRSGFNGFSSSYGAPARDASSAPVYGPSSNGYNGNGNGNGRESNPNARANILRYNSENNGDGTYQFEFETENEITQQEAGELRDVGPEGEVTVVKGSYSYLGDDGQTYTVNYIADENGFRPTGDHIHREIQAAASDAGRNAQSEDGYPDRNQYNRGYNRGTGQNGYRY